MKRERTSVRRVTASLAAACLLLWLAACQPETRYRTLNFIFDGVPNPNAPPGPQLTRVAAQQAAFHPTRTAPPRSTPLPIVSVHKPYQERQCLQCHQNTRTMEPQAIDERLCDKCHADQRRREGWHHGPINLGTCVPCHVPHTSVYPHLLAAPVPDLCLNCHYNDMGIYVPEHLVADVMQCTACHDPHTMY